MIVPPFSKMYVLPIGRASSHWSRIEKIFTETVNRIPWRKLIGKTVMRERRKRRGMIKTSPKVKPKMCRERNGIKSAVGKRIEKRQLKMKRKDQVLSLRLFLMVNAPRLSAITQMPNMMPMASSFPWAVIKMERRRTIWAVMPDIPRTMR